MGLIVLFKSAILCLKLTLYLWAGNRIMIQKLIHQVISSI